MTGKSPIDKKWESSQNLLQFAKEMVDSQDLALYKYLSEMAEKTTDPKERESFKKEMEGFKELFSRYKASKGKSIEWAKIKPPPPDMVIDYSKLHDFTDNQKGGLLKKLCVVKLNGGLGTTMGCTGPKSIIEVHSGLSFLDLTVHQIQYLNRTYGSNVPLVLMNSFNTEADTAKIIMKYKNSADIKTFNQSQYPRVLKESLLPIADSLKSHPDCWYPPGHGDVFRAFANSGLLDQMIAEGKEYVFISNIDNLGATVDLKILNHMVEHNVEFVMEVTEKTRNDVKGGTLIDYEGKAKLFEIAQCPSAHVEEFKSIKKFKIFNTNNLWVNLKAIKSMLETGGGRNVDVIVNPKNALGREVIQLEIAAGAFIECFKNAKGINVDRSRFLPVKSTSDLLVVQSNLYEMENGFLVMSNKRPFPTVPLVKLGEEFKKVADYQKRFKDIPNIIELDQLTVSGDVTFGSGTELRGNVIIVANHGSRIDIPSGAMLENKVISGNLRIVDH